MKSTFSLRKGEAFRIDGVNARIVNLLDDKAVTIEAADGVFLIMTKAELLEAYANGRIGPCLSDPQPTPRVPVYGRTLQELPEHQRNCAHRAWQYVKRLQELGVPSWVPKVVKPHIDQIAKEIDDPKPPHPSTVYRWYVRYMTRRDIRALVPRFDKRGPSLPRTSPRVIELFTQALEDVAKLTKAWTVPDIEARLVDLIERENRDLLDGARLRKPSRSTIYRLLNQVEVYDMTTLREGRRPAQRLTVSKITVAARKILERVEIDHTPLDLFILHHGNHIPCGRPTLTMLLDAFSRMPLGYYVSFAGPSTNAVIRAVKHAITPKRPVETAIPGLTVDNSWPCYGLFDCLVADNGLEFHSRALEDNCQILNIDLRFCPVRQPRFKGKIERFLKTLNYGFVHKLPGTSLAKWTDRGEYDPLKHAVLTLPEFLHLLEKWILDVYAQTPHRGIGTTPFRKWCDAARLDPPRLPTNMESLVEDLGIPATRCLRHDGIRFENLYYVGAELTPILRAYGEGVAVQIAYDPDDLGSIRVWEPDSEKPVVATAANASYAKGLTLEQHRHIQAQIREQQDDVVDQNALLTAKSSIVNAMELLLSARKLKSRQRAARFSGISSTSPLGHSTPTAPALKSPEAQASGNRPVRQTRGGVRIPRYDSVQRN